LESLGGPHCPLPRRCRKRAAGARTLHSAPACGTGLATSVLRSAHNKANEIIDKKEINLTSGGSTVIEGANSSGTTPANPPPAETSTYSSAPAPAPAPAPVPRDTSIGGPTSTYSPPPPPAPSTSSYSSTNTTAENRRLVMPATASNDGALLLAGGALLLGSYLIRRKA
jgi:hypothetical protein